MGYAVLGSRLDPYYLYALAPLKFWLQEVWLATSISFRCDYNLTVLQLAEAFKAATATERKTDGPVACPDGRKSWW